MAAGFRVCEQMSKLRQMLNEKGVHWEDHSQESENFWICRTRFKHKGVEVSVINGFGTYGGFNIVNPNNMGLLEMWIQSESNPEGFLSAKQIMEKLYG